MPTYESREKYYDAVKQQLETNIFYHSLALEACMEGLYDYLESEGRITEDEDPKEDWMLAGLVHDIDYSGEYKEEHPEHTKEALAKYDLEISDTVYDIVQAHDGRQHDMNLEKLSHWSIFCADSLTGLIVAVALVYPSKKLEDVKLKSIIKRFKKDPRFAAGTRRDEVILCEREGELNMPIEKFIEVCFEAMKGISDEIGL